MYATAGGGKAECAGRWVDTAQASRNLLCLLQFSQQSRKLGCQLRMLTGESTEEKEDIMTY